MTDVTADDVMREVRGALVEVAGARAPGETIERWLERAARSLGISYARAFNYWHRRVRRVDAAEYLTIQKRRQLLIGTRITDLRAELARLEGKSIVQTASAPAHKTENDLLARRI